MSRFVLAMVLLLCTSASTLEAQRRATGEPPRPVLSERADTNDWNNYYNHGLLRFNEQPREAFAAFYWALRLNPGSAEALYGQWATFWMSDLRRYIGYLAYDPAVVSRSEVIQNDSLILRALQLNPMLHMALNNRMLEQAYRFVNRQLRWDQLDHYTAGWLHYSKGEMGPAAERFRRVVNSRSGDRNSARLYLARAHYMLGFHDSSAHHLQVLLDDMRKADEKRVVFWYQSKALMEYSIGYVYADAKRYDDAREAFGRALTEDLAYYVAHARMGDIARAQGDTGTAVLAYGMAVELRSNDPVTLTSYGAALIEAQRADEAEPHLRRSLALEPLYAPTWFQLARSFDEQRKAQEAFDHYGRFIALAPRTSAREVTMARRRMAALRSQVASATDGND